MPLEKKEPVCPNCGGHQIKHRWVEKTPKAKIVDVDLEEYAKELKQDLGGVQIIHGDLNWPRLEQYSQLVLECEDCGYTKTFDISAVNSN